MRSTAYKFRTKRPFCWTSCVVLTAFCLNLILPPQSFAQNVLSIPKPGAFVPLTEVFVPTLIKGIKIDPQNPLHFDFIVDSGHSHLQGQALKEETSRLIKYFLAALTTPEKDLWVNLSPYEKDRIVPSELGQTEMGRDMLAQDYLLKQLTSSLMYPEGDLGKKFWDKVYKESYAKYGTTQLPTNTFNKVWIVPERAEVFENDGAAYVTESRLTVKMENDLGGSVTGYRLPIDTKPRSTVSGQLSTNLIKSIILPVLKNEINTGKNFATLRQITHSLILAKWFKETLKENILTQVYADQSKVKGIDLNDKAVKEKIYAQYLEAFKKGVYNYIKEEVDPATNKIIPKKYFSGGLAMSVNLHRVSDASMLTSRALAPVGQRFRADTGVVLEGDGTLLENALAQELPDAAMLTLRNSFGQGLNATLKRLFPDGSPAVIKETLQQLRDPFKEDDLKSAHSQYALHYRQFSNTSLKELNAEIVALFKSILLLQTAQAIPENGWSEEFWVGLIQFVSESKANDILDLWEQNCNGGACMPFAFALQDAPRIVTLMEFLSASPENMEMFFKEIIGVLSQLKNVPDLDRQPWPEHVYGFQLAEKHAAILRVIFDAWDENKVVQIGMPTVVREGDKAMTAQKPGTIVSNNEWLELVVMRLFGPSGIPDGLDPRALNDPQITEARPQFASRQKAKQLNAPLNEFVAQFSDLFSSYLAWAESQQTRKSVSLFVIFLSQSRENFEGFLKGLGKVKDQTDGNDLIALLQEIFSRWSDPSKRVTAATDSSQSKKSDTRGSKQIFIPGMEETFLEMVARLQDAGELPREFLYPPRDWNVETEGIASYVKEIEALNLEQRDQALGLFIDEIRESRYSEHYNLISYFEEKKGMGRSNLRICVDHLKESTHALISFLTSSQNNLKSLRQSLRFSSYGMDSRKRTEEEIEIDLRLLSWVYVITKMWSRQDEAKPFRVQRTIRPMILREQEERTVKRIFHYRNLRENVILEASTSDLQSTKAIEILAESISRFMEEQGLQDGKARHSVLVGYEDDAFKPFAQRLAQVFAGNNMRVDFVKQATRGDHVKKMTTTKDLGNQAYDFSISVGKSIFTEGQAVFFMFMNGKEIDHLEKKDVKEKARNHSSTYHVVEFKEVGAEEIDVEAVLKEKGLIQDQVDAEELSSGEAVTLKLKDKSFSALMKRKRGKGGKTDINTWQIPQEDVTKYVEPLMGLSEEDLEKAFRKFLKEDWTEGLALFTVPFTRAYLGRDPSYINRFKFLLGTDDQFFNFYLEMIHQNIKTAKGISKDEKDEDLKKFREFHLRRQAFTYVICKNWEPKIVFSNLPTMKSNDGQVFTESFSQAVHDGRINEFEFAEVDPAYWDVSEFADYFETLKLDDFDALNNSFFNFIKAGGASLSKFYGRDHPSFHRGLQGLIDFWSAKGDEFNLYRELSNIDQYLRKAEEGYRYGGDEYWVSMIRNLNKLKAWYYLAFTMWDKEKSQGYVENEQSQKAELVSEKGETLAELVQRTKVSSSDLRDDFKYSFIWRESDEGYDEYVRPLLDLDLEGLGNKLRILLQSMLENAIMHDHFDLTKNFYIYRAFRSIEDKDLIRRFINSISSLFFSVIFGTSDDYIQRLENVKDKQASETEFYEYSNDEIQAAYQLELRRKALLHVIALKWNKPLRQVLPKTGEETVVQEKPTEAVADKINITAEGRLGDLLREIINLCPNPPRFKESVAALEIYDPQKTPGKDVVAALIHLIEANTSYDVETLNQQNAERVYALFAQASKLAFQNEYLPLVVSKRPPILAEIVSVIKEHRQASNKGGADEGSLDDYVQRETESFSEETIGGLQGKRHTSGEDYTAKFYSLFFAYQVLTALERGEKPIEPPIDKINITAEGRLGDLLREIVALCPKRESTNRFREWDSLEKYDPKKTGGFDVIYDLIHLIETLNAEYEKENFTQRQALHLNELFIEAAKLAVKNEFLKLDASRREPIVTRVTEYVKKEKKTGIDTMQHVEERLADLNSKMIEFLQGKHQGIGAQWKSTAYWNFFGFQVLTALEQGENLLEDSSEDSASEDWSEVLTEEQKEVIRIMEKEFEQWDLDEEEFKKHVNGFLAMPPDAFRDEANELRSLAAGMHGDKDFVPFLDAALAQEGSVVQNLLDYFVQENKKDHQRDRHFLIGFSNAYDKYIEKIRMKISSADRRSAGEGNLEERLDFYVQRKAWIFAFVHRAKYIHDEHIQWFSPAALRSASSELTPLQLQIATQMRTAFIDWDLDDGEFINYAGIFESIPPEDFRHETENLFSLADLYDSFGFAGNLKTALAKEGSVVVNLLEYFVEEMAAGKTLGNFTKSYDKEIKRLRQLKGQGKVVDEAHNVEEKLEFYVYRKAWIYAFERRIKNLDAESMPWVMVATPDEISAETRKPDPKFSKEIVVVVDHMNQAIGQWAIADLELAQRKDEFLKWDDNTFKERTVAFLNNIFNDEGATFLEHHFSLHLALNFLAREEVQKGVMNLLQSPKGKIDQVKVRMDGADTSSIEGQAQRDLKYEIDRAAWIYVFVKRSVALVYNVPVDVAMMTEAKKVVAIEELRDVAEEWFLPGFFKEFELADQVTQLMLLFKNLELDEEAFLSPNKTINAHMSINEFHKIMQHIFVNEYEVSSIKGVKIPGIKSALKNFNEENDEAEDDTWENVDVEREPFLSINVTEDEEDETLQLARVMQEALEQDLPREKVLAYYDELVEAYEKWIDMEIKNSFEGKKILIIGASSFLGQTIYDIFSGMSDNIVGTRFESTINGAFVSLDVTDEASVEKFIREQKPNVIIYAAAEVSNPDEDKSRKLNVTPVRTIGKYFKGHFIYVSSDTVFKGEKGAGPYAVDAKINGVGAYGRTKGEGEKAAQETFSELSIVRLGLLFGHNTKEDKMNLLKKIVEHFDLKESFEVDDQQQKQHIFMDDVAQKMMKIIEDQQEGVVHLGGTKMTRYQFALLVAEIYAQLYRDFYGDEIVGAKFANILKGLASKQAQRMDFNNFSYDAELEMTEEDREALTPLKEALRQVIPEISSVIPDKAMLTPGGIDFSSRKNKFWHIERRGRQIHFDIEPAYLEKMRVQGVEGVTPVIFSIEPLPNVLPLLGLAVQ